MCGMSDEVGVADRIEKLLLSIPLQVLPTPMLSDDQILALLAEIKPLPQNWKSKLKVKIKANTSHAERELSIPRTDGGSFTLVLRHNITNPLDFSVVLVYEDPSGKTFTLRRYNGKHPSGHTNKWEKANGMSDFYFRNVCHIHTATQRYQEADYQIDGFAEPTTKYTDFKSAVESFIRDHAFELPMPAPSDTGNLFGSETIQ